MIDLVNGGHLAPGKALRTARAIHPARPVRPLRSTTFGHGRPFPPRRRRGQLRHGRAVDLRYAPAAGKRAKTVGRDVGVTNLRFGLHSVFFLDLQVKNRILQAFHV